MSSVVFTENSNIYIGFTIKTSRSSKTMHHTSHDWHKSLASTNCPKLKQLNLSKTLSVCQNNCYMYNALCATGNICPRKVNLICSFVAFIYQFTSHKFCSIPLFIITTVQHQKPGNMKGPGDCEFCSDNKEASRFDKPLSFPALFDHGISRKNIGWEDVRCMQWWGTTSQWTAAEGPHHVNTPINALLQYTLLLENNCFIMPPVRFCILTLERWMAVFGKIIYSILSLLEIWRNGPAWMRSHLNCFLFVVVFKNHICPFRK